MTQEWLEPKLGKKEKNGDGFRISYPQYDELLPEKAKKTYYAKYRVIKKFPTPVTVQFAEEDRIYSEEGNLMLVQVLLPHQDVGFHCGFHNEYILEALAKGYLEFVGVEEDDEED